MRRKWEEWISDGEKEFTKNGNRKKVSYELICRWVSETWKEISTELLVKSFEVTGLILDTNGSENYKMTDRLQAIIENRINDINIEELLSEDDILTSDELDLKDMIETNYDYETDEEKNFENMIEIDDYE